MRGADRVEVRGGGSVSETSVEGRVNVHWVLVWRYGTVLVDRQLVRSLSRLLIRHECGTRGWRSNGSHTTRRGGANRGFASTGRCGVEGICAGLCARL